MKLKMKLILLLGVLGYVVAQDDCGAQMTKTFDCMKTGFKDVLDKVDSMKVDHDKFEGELLKCFTESGCKDISEDMAMKHDKGPRPRELTEVMTRLQSLMGVMDVSEERLEEVVMAGAECAKSMKMDVVPSIETCVQETNPALSNFALPMMPDRDDTKPGRPLIGGPHELVGKKLRHVMNMHKTEMKTLKHLAWSALHKDVCPTEETQTKVQECLLAAEKTNIPEELTCMSPMTMIFKLMKVREDLCVKHDDCHVGMTEECVVLKDQVPKAICTCANAYLEDNWEMIVSSMSTCINGKLDEPFTLPSAMVNGPFKSMAKNMVKKECNKMNPRRQPNPCSPNFDPFEGGRHKMGNMKGRMERGHMKGRSKGMPPKLPPPVEPKEPMAFSEILTAGQ